MAGLGWRQWTRERLTSAALQGYIQDQVIARFSSASAANAAVAAPTEGMHRSLDDTNRLEFHTGAAWVPRGPRIITRNHTPVSSLIPAGAGRESGVADGPAIAPFTVHEQGPALFIARMRCSMSGSGWINAYIKLDGVVVGGGLLRSTLDEDHVFLGYAANVTVGSHTPSLRVDAAAGGAAGSWVDATLDILLTGGPE